MAATRKSAMRVPILAHGAAYAKRRHVASDKKLRELILLICNRSENDPPFGATKLNKLLFFCDFIAYLEYGSPITGHEYFRLPKGPAPKKLVPIRERMKSRGELAYKQVDYFSYKQERPIALREPDVSEFSAREIDLVDRVVRKFLNKTASEISEYSHGFIGWKIAKQRELIPYHMALIGTRKPTPDEEKRGLKLDTLAKQCLARP